MFGVLMSNSHYLLFFYFYILRGLQGYAKGDNKLGKPVVWSPASAPRVLFQSDEWMKDTHHQLKFTGQDILSRVIVLLLMDGWMDGLIDWYRHSRRTPHQISKKSPRLFD